MKKEIEKGDSVLVKSGVTDPDYEYDIGGWQGRVTFIDPDDGSIFLLIKWDINTLEQMPHEVIEANIKDDLDFTEMWLNRNEVELAESRDMPQDAEKKATALNEQFGYVSSDEQEKNISKILDAEDLSVSGKNQAGFYDYLSEQFKTPCILTGSEDFTWEEPYVMGVFDQKEYEELKKKRPSYTDHYKLVRLEDTIDDLRGILVKVKRISDKKVFILPLWDLETVDKKDQNHQLISDYSFWMTNYR